MTTAEPATQRTAAGESGHFREQWQALSRAGITLAALQAFYARYKYLIMSRHIAAYHAIGTLLANAKKDALPTVAQRLFELIAQALAQPITRGGDVNALLHISGYLKAQLSSAEKLALLDAIEKYRRGEIEFEVPRALLQSHFERFPNAYIQQQLFLQKP